MKDYLVWSPERNERFGKIEWALKDEKGRNRTLYNGMPESEMPEHLSGILEGGSIVPDFVYDIGLIVIASAGVASLVLSMNFKVKAAATPVDLVRPTNGERHEYFWVNPLRTVALMDERRSQFQRSSAGVFRRIDRFAVRTDLRLSDDLLVCDELALPVFSAELVRAVGEAGLTGAVFTPLASYRDGF